MSFISENQLSVINYLFKKLQNRASTRNLGDYFLENILSQTPIFNQQILAESDKIPIPAPKFLEDGREINNSLTPGVYSTESNIVEYCHKITLEQLSLLQENSFVTKNSKDDPDSNILKNAIPSLYDIKDGSYGIKVERPW